MPYKIEEISQVPLIIVVNEDKPLREADEEKLIEMTIEKIRKPLIAYQKYIYGSLYYKRSYQKVE